jgi:hypothetical protein
MRRLLQAMLLTAVVGLSATTAWAQITMPLRRIEVLNPSPNLAAWSNMHITDPVFENDGGGFDSDDYLAWDTDTLSSSLSTMSCSGEVVCTTAVDGLDTVGEVDSSFIGHAILTDIESNGFVNPLGRGVAEFVVEAHPNHPNLASFTLRADLWALFLRTDVRTTGGMRISINNLTSGREVTLTVVYNGNTDEFEWTKNDGDGDVTTGGGFSVDEFFHVEHNDVSVGDTIRVEARYGGWSGSIFQTIDEMFEGKATGWFDVIGT